MVRRRNIIIKEIRLNRVDNIRSKNSTSVQQYSQQQNDYMEGRSRLRQTIGEICFHVAINQDKNMVMRVKRKINIRMKEKQSTIKLN